MRHHCLVIARFPGSPASPLLPNSAPRGAARPRPSSCPVFRPPRAAGRRCRCGTPQLRSRPAAPEPLGGPLPKAGAGAAAAARTPESSAPHTPRIYTARTHAARGGRGGAGVCSRAARPPSAGLAGARLARPLPARARVPRASASAAPWIPPPPLPITLGDGLGARAPGPRACPIPTV
ncbi:MAG: hypothetical protein J3K34DRAFT_414613 [Monoraphidium minutum]|nr:MAG: hypothetical protein J3K34DRAFT_414613 [Monoraphidium minutum]